ncbi:hypothetical protein [Ruminococcus sp.]|uniref:CdaR family protein n=1 Tax=Ruminococcus sp. TaxID=41978 RepID=UPI002CA50C9E|nr:hypothetical protein [Ruminococcus sp.]HNZ99897.1 hypothetical protein [Ruminococcus sp.]
MSILKNITKRNIKEARSNAMLLLIAFVCAIASWFIIAMTKYPSDSKHVSNIPLSRDISGTAAADSGLSIIECSVGSVSVSLDCSRTDYNRISADSLKATIDFKNITVPGTYTLNVKVESTNDAEISNLVISPATVRVELDQYETKAFVLKAKVPNISGGENKAINSADITCEPGEVNIKGPASKLASIAECYAVSNQEKTLDSSYSLNSDEYQLFSEDGTEISSDKLTFDPPLVNMTIPALTQKTVKFVPQIVDAPSGFDTDCLKFKIDPETITIATNNTETKLPDKLELKLRLSELDIGFSTDRLISNLLMGTNITNMSDTDTVNISLDSEGLASRDITITSSNIPILNTPSKNYDYVILNPTFIVKIVGPSEAVNDVTAADLDVVVDLLGADDSMDQFPYSVKVSCSKYDNIWSVTSNTVNVKKTLKEGMTTQASESGPTMTTTTAG